MYINDWHEMSTVMSKSNYGVMFCVYVNKFLKLLVIYLNLDLIFRYLNYVSFENITDYN